MSTTSASPASWERLVRYLPEDGEAFTPRYGEPIISDIRDDVGELATAGKLEVKVLDGTSPFDLTETGRRERVGRLLGPLTEEQVPIIRCIGLNYKSHILETGRALPGAPTLFTKPGPAVAAWNEDIPIPSIAQSQCDYEGELVVVIGKAGKNISEDKALEHVAAYTVGNDVSARDWQREPDKAGPVPQWGFSKSFDKYAPLGPCLVSPSVLGDASGLSLKTFVNGEVRQSSNTSDLYFDVRKLVAFCSQGQTLQQGSLIMTGTPGGVGLFMNPQGFVQHNDVVDVEIERIGRIRNRFVFESR
ncbi:hypothetical protein IL306_013676 [Fusarium sp. DS 682]|nr:hypothetical protein IL306_013676 [Fusarium sp. DS 682]